jgi:hypothetical protein
MMNFSIFKLNAMRQSLLTIFAVSLLAACSESGVMMVFDENQPFNPKSLRFSIELNNDLKDPRVIDHCRVKLYDLEDDPIRLEKGQVTFNGVPLKRWDQVEPWTGHGSYYTGRDIPVSAGDITISLKLAGQEPAALAHFELPKEVAIEGISWPEKIVSDQPLVVSWEGISPLNQLSVPQHSLKGGVAAMKIRPKGSMDLKVPIMKAQNRVLEVKGGDAKQTLLSYAKIEFGTHLQGEIAEGIKQSKATMYLYTNRVIRQ